MKVRSSFNQRLQKLPPYLFAEIDKKKKAAIQAGVDLISLGVGDPDQPTPPSIVKAGQSAMADPKHHQYPFGAGLMDFRKSVAEFMKRRFNVSVDPASEIYTLIGSKEGIGHLPLATINVGDVVLVPDPGYPVYQGSTLLAGGEVYHMPLLKENNFLPDYEAIPQHVLDRSALLFIGYPNNPTAAVATRDFFEKTVAFARENHLIVAHDNAYSEIYYGEPPISFLETPGAREVGVEFHSLSKTFNMTGWRLGWVCGNADIIRRLATVKDNYDSGAFEAVQAAGLTALNGPSSDVEAMRTLYKERRDVFVPALKSHGWALNNPEATFYVWAQTPPKLTAMQTVSRILEEGVLCTPGNGFGPSGEGFVRFALTVDKPRLQEAIKRIGRIRW